MVLSYCIHPMTAQNFCIWESLTSQYRETADALVYEHTLLRTVASEHEFACFVPGGVRSDSLLNLFEINLLES